MMVEVLLYKYQHTSTLFSDSEIQTRGPFASWIMEVVHIIY